MREILFRGKGIARDEWLTGFLVDGKHIGNWVEADPVNPDTVGQFTGLTDKNGKRIFEGDILKADGIAYACFWDSGNLEFGLEDQTESFGLCYYAPHDLEVIGNIHDNNLEDFNGH